MQRWQARRRTTSGSLADNFSLPSLCCLSLFLRCKICCSRWSVAVCMTRDAASAEIGVLLRAAVMVPTEDCLCSSFSFFFRFPANSLPDHVQRHYRTQSVAAQGESQRSDRCKGESGRVHRSRVRAGDLLFLLSIACLSFRSRRDGR